MTNISKLKKGKGAPPAMVEAPRNTDMPARDKKVVVRPVQFKVPEHIVDDFDQEAAKNFGFRKGAKTQMFLKLWADYQKSMKA